MSNPTSQEQRIMRVIQGQPIPAGWSMVEWLGTETDITYGPTFKADVVLVEKVGEPWSPPELCGAPKSERACETETPTKPCWCRPR